MTELLYNLIWLQPWVVLPITGALQISACPRDNAGHLVFFFFCDGKYWVHWMFLWWASHNTTATLPLRLLVISACMRLGGR